MDDTLYKIKLLNEIGIALSSADDINVPDTILNGAMDLTDADGGSLYLLSENKTELKFEIIRNHTLGIHIGGKSTNNKDFPSAPCLYEDGQPNMNSVVTVCIHDNRTINISDVYHEKGFDFSGARNFDRECNYLTQSVLTVPLKNHLNEIIGVLQLVNAKDKSKKQVNEKTGKEEYITRDFSGADQQLAESLASQAAVAITKNKLIEEQRQLLWGFVNMTVEALKKKSLYTGGHCDRVPQIAKMMAQAAINSHEGIFKDFSLDDDEWAELKMAALLHDCGKTATPEYVVDKATKLETIYDRIHEVRMRFEVLKRDAEIECWKNIAGGANENEQRTILDERCQQIDDDFAFVAECNIGGEFMADENIERLHVIAQKIWVRTLDDNLGVSWEESERKSHGDSEKTRVACSLPVEENLLADKVEHRVLRNEKEIELANEISKENNQWGFNVRVPEYKSNRGELYNLGVKRGTLTEEDRYTINEHMIHTIVMLEEMPFKNELANVPFIAASHHETMDGKGYPKKLKMSEKQPGRSWKNMQTAKMMVIADVFEALTASDRPYKKPKTLTESLRILSFMRNDQHIDADLFDLFLTSGVYLEYADKFLLPEQIDEVDINDYLST